MKLSLLSKKIFIITGFIILLAISEFNYLSNHPYRQLTRYLRFAHQTAKLKNNYLTFYFLNTATHLRLNELKSQYPDLVFQPPSVNPFANSTKQQKNNYTNILSSLDISLYIDKYYSSLSKSFYQFGLLNIGSDEQSLEQFWKLSILLSPEWSYPHVELANYYLSNHQIELAKQTIDFCNKFFSPKKHCQEFLTTNISQNQPETIGFLETVINSKM